MGGSDVPDHMTTMNLPAPYVQVAHTEYMNLMKTHRGAIIGDSPFEGYTDIEVETAFFGTGYTIASFPSLYDMFGKFMAGLDIEVLFSQVYEDTVNAPAINNLVSAETAMMDDDIDTNVLPRFKEGMRDINSVMSSSFVVGKSVIEDARVKALSKFSAELKYRMIPVATEKWKAHLDWNKSVTGVYAEFMKFYYSAAMDVTDFNNTTLAKDKLWPFTVLEYNRVAVGVLQQAIVSRTDVAGSGASQTGKAISGALGGAVMGATLAGSLAGGAGAFVGIGTGAGTGAMIGGAAGPIGAAVGAVVGLAASFL